jgi:hypothetical protein
MHSAAGRPGIIPGGSAACGRAGVHGSRSGLARRWPSMSCRKRSRSLPALSGLGSALAPGTRRSKNVSAGVSGRPAWEPIAGSVPLSSCLQWPDLVNKSVLAAVPSVSACKRRSAASTTDSSHARQLSRSSAASASVRVLAGPDRVRAGPTGAPAGTAARAACLAVCCFCRP